VDVTFCHLLVTDSYKEDGTSETSMTPSQSTRRNIPEDLSVHRHCFENLIYGSVLISGLRAKF